MLAETREPLPACPGRPRREDYEYVRAGTRNPFLTCEPKRGWRHVAVTQRRTMQDFAQQMRWLVDEAYPDAPVVRLVLDNLNTHRVASLYEAFPPGTPDANSTASTHAILDFDVMLVNPPAWSNIPPPITGFPDS